MPTPKLVIEPHTRFGKLTIVKEVPPVKKARTFLLKCDCGKYSEVRLSHLKTGHTKSCGCLGHKQPKQLSLWQRIVIFFTEKNPEW